MARIQKLSLILSPAFIFSYVGILGYIIFFFLRPSIDLTSGTSISHTASDALDRVHLLNEALGFESFELSGMAFRINNNALWASINNERSVRITPYILNKNQVSLNSWRVTIGDKYKETAILFSDTKVFSDVGIIQVELSDRNQILSIETRPGASPLFFETDLNINHFNFLISEIFGYSLSNYTWANQKEFIDLESSNSFYNSLNYDTIFLPEEGVYTLHKVNPRIPGPISLSLNYTSGVRSLGGEVVANGIIIQSFSTTFLSEEHVTIEAEKLSEKVIFNAFSFVATIIIIGAIILITGLRQIFKGRVEWKRSIIVFLFITITSFIWSVFFYSDNLYTFIDKNIVYLDVVQQLFVAMLFGLFAFLAYISWESLARDLKSEQIPVIDAFWSGKLFQKQIGIGILYAYSTAGFMLGAFALTMYAFEGVYIPQDSLTLEARDLATSIPALFISLNALTSATIVVLSQVGIIYCLIAYLTKNNIGKIVATTLLCGLTLYSLNTFFYSDISEYKTIIISLILALPLVLSYRYFGLISAFITWFILLVVVRSAGLIGTVNPELFANLWALGIIVLFPFVIGLVGLRGNSIHSYKAYTPDYETNYDKKLRSEKELAIAKESQYALMPTTAPEVDGFDIRGFFVPSFEVGGDFYDYEIIYDAEKQPTAVALAIVDVSGKAMKSAIQAVFTSGLLLSRIQTDEPEHILREVNPILCKKTDSRTFVTCQIGKVQLSTKILSLSNAGHCLPLLKRNGKTEFIKTNGPRFPLGMRPDVKYEAREIQLFEGDILILYSDGLAEAQNNKGQRLKFSDILNLIDKLESNNMTAQDICESLKKFILDYSDYELADDTTVICLKVI